MISVIIPTHNDGKFLKTAIESIQNQTVKDIEIIVVDDFSTDDTKNVVKSISESDVRVKYFLNNFQDPKRINKYGVNINAGFSARNLGISKAKGEWITFQDGDDFSLLNRLEIQLGLAVKYKVDSVATGVLWLKKYAENTKIDIDSFLAEQNPVFISPSEIKKMAHLNKGLLGRLLPDALFEKIPFRLKQSPVSMGLFFRKFEHYPGAAGPCFVHSKVFKKIKFRPINQRRWPSQKGRGADRDFNFNIAGSGFKCLCVNIPLYAWRTPIPFTLPYNLSKYLR